MPHLGRVVDEVEVVEHERRRLAGHAAELAKEGVEHGVERRRGRRRLAEQAARRGAEVGNVNPDRRDEVRQEADPVAVAAIQPIPEHSDAGSAGEVREQRRLAVAGLGDEEHDPAMDLDRQPLEEAVAGERLVAQRGRLDLADLDRVLGHLAEVASGGR